MSSEDSDPMWEHFGNLEEKLQEPENQLALINHLDDMHRKEEEKAKDNKKKRTGIHLDHAEFLEALQSLTKDHPFKAMQTIVELLTNIVVKSNEAFNSSSSEWAKMEVQALREIKSILKDLMPTYEEQTAKFEKREVKWADKQIDFNMNYIATEFGREHITPYVKALEIFKLELQKNEDIN